MIGAAESTSTVTTGTDLALLQTVTKSEAAAFTIDSREVADATTSVAMRSAVTSGTATSLEAVLDSEVVVAPDWIEARCCWTGSMI